MCRHPYKVLASCLLATAVCGLGLLRFRQERQMINLWVAEVSAPGDTVQHPAVLFRTPSTAWMTPGSGSTFPAS